MSNRKHNMMQKHPRGHSSVSHRDKKAQKYKAFIGNKEQGQGFADKRKKHIENQYRKILSREKQSLATWSERLQKIYQEEDEDDDQEGSASTSGQTAKRDKQTIPTVTTKVAKKPVKFRNAKEDDKPKMTAFHKAELEWKKKQEEKEKRNQEAEKRQHEREEALAKYHRTKMHRHKLLAKKNYKGQPVMASRMQVLLEKIEKQRNS